jgi:hypothetical protein
LLDFLFQQGLGGRIVSASHVDVHRQIACSQIFCQFEPGQVATCILGAFLVDQRLDDERQAGLVLGVLGKQRFQNGNGGTELAAIE